VKFPGEDWAEHEVAQSVLAPPRKELNLSTLRARKLPNAVAGGMCTSSTKAEERALRTMRWH
jgi:hypothetical protein